MSRRLEFATKRATNIHNAAGLIFQFAYVRKGRGGTGDALLEHVEQLAKRIATDAAEIGVVIEFIREIEAQGDAPRSQRLARLIELIEERGSVGAALEALAGEEASQGKPHAREG